MYSDPGMNVRLYLIWTNTDPLYLILGKSETHTALPNTPGAICELRSAAETSQCVSSALSTITQTPHHCVHDQTHTLWQTTLINIMHLQEEYFAKTLHEFLYLNAKWIKPCIAAKSAIKLFADQIINKLISSYVQTNDARAADIISQTQKRERNYQCATTFQVNTERMNTDWL